MKKVPITVDARIRIPMKLIGSKVVEDLQRKFTHKNPAHAKAKQFSKWTKEKPFVRMWGTDGGRSAKGVNPHDKVLTIPRGGMPRVREVLQEHGMSWAVTDRRTRGTGARGIGGSHKVKLWDFQEEIVANAIERQNCLVRAPTGSGKTTAAIAFACEVDLTTLVIVHSKALLDQWRRRLREETGIRERDIGQIGDGKRKIGIVTIAITKSLANCLEEVREEFGVVICDEVHKFAAPSFLRTIDPLPAMYRLGVSDDERRKDGKQFLIYDVFGDVAADIDREELIRRRFIHDVEIRMVPTEFSRDWYTEIDERGDEEGKPPAHVEKQRAFKRLVEEMSADDERNKLAAELIAKEVQAGEQVLAFCHRREHCHRLSAMLDAMGVEAGIMYSGDTADDRRRFNAALGGLRQGSMRAAIGTYQSIGTGVDLPTIGRGVCVTPTHSNPYQFRQVRGRVCRMGSDDAVMYVLWDRGIYPKSPLYQMLRLNNVVRVLDGKGWIEGEAFRSKLERQDDEDDDMRDLGFV